MKNISLFAISGLVLAFGLMGCGETAPEGGTNAPSGTKSATKTETGSINIDGSNTVLPISSAIAEGFEADHKDVHVTVAGSGTGGGFKKFANGELDITGASRPIEEKEEALCKEKGIEYIEIPIAFDGLTIVVNKENTALSAITTEELKKIWEPDSKVKMWSDLKPGLPKEAIKLYGPGTDSGTFDYFTETICGKKGAIRSDYSQSGDYNQLVSGVAGDKWALGFFGFAYFDQNKDKLKALTVNGIAPSATTIEDGTYKPLARPLFWYVNLKSLEKPEVQELVSFMLKDAAKLVVQAKYNPLPAEAYTLGEERVKAKKTGSLFKGAKAGLKIADVLKAEQTAKK